MLDLTIQSLLDPAVAASLAFHVLGETTVLVLLATAATLLLRRGTPGQRHAVWSATFVLALALPFAGAVVPTVDLPLLEATRPPLAESAPYATTASDASTAPGSAEAATPESAVPAPAAGVGDEPARAEAGSAAPGLPVDAGTAGLVFLVVWATGVLALGVRLAGHWVRIAVVTHAGRDADAGDPVARVVRREAARLGVRRPVRVVWSSRLGVPVTGGLLRPVLILPPDARRWPEDRLRAVLLHELVHVRRWDLLSHQVAELARVVYWINPLLWIAHHLASGERERACDREVVRTGVPGHEYAGVLVEMARRAVVPTPALEGGLSFARPGEILRKRVDAVLDDGRTRRSVPRWAAAAAGLLLVVGAVPLATVELRAGTGPGPTVAALASELSAGSTGARIDAVRRLARICFGESTRLLARVLDEDPDPGVRTAAAGALGRHGQPGSLVALRRAAADATEARSVRTAAVQAMATVDHPAAVAALHALLDDADSAVRWLAVTGLGRRATPDDRRVVDALTRVLRTDPEPRIRAAAASLVHGLGCEDSAVHLERARTGDPSALVRARAAKLLGVAGHRPPRSPGLVGAPPTV